MRVIMIKPYDALALLKYENSILIDVRPRDSYDMGHIEGAVSFPFDQVTKESAAKLIPDKSTAVVVYCQTGRHAKMVTDKLVSYGYEKVYDLGAITDWPYAIVKS